MNYKKRKSTVYAKGYSEAGASTTRRSMKGFIPRSGSPNDDINDNNGTLRQRARMLYMASPVATSAIDTNRTKVVGVGLTLRSTINREALGMTAEQAKAWQKKTESEFALWASKKQNCDAIGVNNFSALQQLAIKSWLLSGDVFAVLKREKPTKQNPYSLRIHLVEADRVATPSNFGGNSGFLGVTTGTNLKNGNKIYDGVEVDSSGKVVAYHIRNTYPYAGVVETTEWERITAFGEKTGIPNILQIMDSERPDQYRGVPYLAQVMEPLLQMRRYTESELMAALVQSFFTAWITTETDPSDIPINEVGISDISGIPAENPDGMQTIAQPEMTNDYEMGSGTILHLQPGEKVAFGQPNIPTAGFETFTKSICRLIGAGLEMPYDVLVKEFNSSYSASRAALMEAWEAFRMRRVWFVDDFCQPVYEAWLAEAVALGRIKAPGFWDDPLVREAWCGARWIGPTQGSLDPKKEADASVTLAAHGFKTHEQLARELGGGDWEENAEQLAHENALLQNAVQNSDGGTDVQ